MKAQPARTFAKGHPGLKLRRHHGLADAYIVFVENLGQAAGEEFEVTLAPDLVFREADEATEGAVCRLIGIIRPLDGVEILRAGKDGIQHAPVLRQGTPRPRQIALSRLELGQLLAQLLYLAQEGRFSFARVLHEIEGNALVSAKGGTGDYLFE